MERKGFNWKRWLGAFFYGVALITVYKTFDNFAGVFKTVREVFSLFTPFLIGFILAFFLYPAALWLEKKLADRKMKFLVKHRKTISVLTVYFSFIAVLVLGISVILPKVSVSLAEFLTQLPDYLFEIERFIVNHTEKGTLLAKLHLDEMLRSISTQEIMQRIFMQDVWSYVKGVKGITDALMGWLMGIVICAYALLEKNSLFRIVRIFFGLFMKSETMDRIGGYVGKISNIFYKFFFGKMVDSLIIGILALIGFTLLNVPYAVLMAVIVMIFNMIPYFGPLIGAIPPVLVAFFSGEIYSAIWVALFIFVLQQFDGIWLGPKILGDSVGVSPFWVIFAILIFGGLFGIWGMIFGVPAIAAIRMLAKDYFDDRKVNMSAEEEEKVKK